MNVEKLYFSHTEGARHQPILCIKPAFFGQKYRTLCTHSRNCKSAMVLTCSSRRRREYGRRVRAGAILALYISSCVIWSQEACQRVRCSAVGWRGVCADGVVAKSVPAGTPSSFASLVVELGTRLPKGCKGNRAAARRRVHLARTIDTCDTCFQI